MGAHPAGSHWGCLLRAGGCNHTAAAHEASGCREACSKPGEPPCAEHVCLNTQQSCSASKHQMQVNPTHQPLTCFQCVPTGSAPSYLHSAKECKPLAAGNRGLYSCDQAMPQAGSYCSVDPAAQRRCSWWSGRCHRALQVNFSQTSSSRAMLSEVLNPTQLLRSA